jgi:cobalt/nickel transport system permease protein
MAFERFSYVCSPIHDLDARAKAVAALIAVAGIVLSPSPRPAEFAALSLLFLSVILLARLPVGALLARSALVLPLAAGIALFAPLSSWGSQGVDSVGEAYRQGWPLAWSIVAKAWLSATTVLLVSATTSPPDLFTALRRLRVPLIFITMLTFLYRYAAVLGGQLSSMRRAVASRAPALTGLRLVRLYGSLSGNLFIRSYERGERVHAAMLSRGYDGTLPTAEVLSMQAADVLLIATALLVSASVILY